MSWARRLWVVLALVAIVASSAILVSSVFGDGGVTVDDVSVSGETPTNSSANCESVVVRSLTVSVTVSRGDLSPRYPQWWGVGVTVRASAFDRTDSRTASVPPDAERTVKVPLTTTREGRWAPLQHVDTIVQVSQGSATLDKRTVTTTLQPVTAGESC